VDDQRLFDRRANAEARVERLVRILVDDLHPPPERAEPARREGGDVLAVEADDPGIRLEEPEDRLGGRRLPTARLADEREHLAAAEEE
jgi:hypothetical protein